MEARRHSGAGRRWAPAEVPALAVADVRRLIDENRIR